MEEKENEQNKQVQEQKSLNKRNVKMSNTMGKRPIIKLLSLSSKPPFYSPLCDAVLGLCKHHSCFPN